MPCSTVWTASLKSMPSASLVSISVAMKSSESARIALIATIGPEIDCPDPGARNSNRLPVKANGLVRLRSPGSALSFGRVSTPTSRVPPLLEPVAPPLAIWSYTSIS